MAKIKINIPAQSFEIEADFQPVIEVEIPKPEPLPIPEEKPEEQEIFDLDSFFKGASGILRIPSTARMVKSKGMIKPEKVTAIIGVNQFLQFQNWDETPNQLFDLDGCEEFAVVGITFVCPPNRPIKTAFPSKSLFGWKRDSVKKGKFAWINAPEVKDEELVTFGLSSFAYSSDSNNDIYLIAKNVFHNGFNFTQIKNPYNGNLWLILQNVNIHNPIIEEPQSHFYSPTRIKCRIYVQGGVIKIISDNTFDQILTHWGYEGGVTSLIHFNRYAFQILTKNLVDEKTLIINQEELHPLDNLEGFGTVIEKQIKNPIGSGFDYKFDQSTKDQTTLIKLPEGEFDAYLIYKGNAMFPYPITKDTKFGPDYWESGIVTLSQGYGWSWYNNEFSGYIENFNGLGYFRNSGGTGITKGLTIKNSFFQKNGPVQTSEAPMPKEAKDYIEYLESL